MNPYPHNANSPVYVVDDDGDFRGSIVKLLDQAGWEVTPFESATAFTNSLSTLAPGIILLDVRLPDLGGLDLLVTHSADLDAHRIVIVTGHGDVDTAVRALKLGAVDFVEKPFEPKILLRLLDTLASQAKVQSELTTREAAARFKVERLTLRERQVLQGLLAGGSNKMIARHLDISDRTVEQHRARMLQKMGVSTSAEAIQIGTLGRLNPAW